jgi:hypothetical protein
MNATNSIDVLLLDGLGKADTRATPPVRSLDTSEEVLREFTRGGRDARFWVARGTSALRAALGGAARKKLGEHRLVVLEAITPAQEAFLRALFRSVLPLGHARCLPLAELAGALASEYRDRLFIGGIVDRDDGVVVLYRADLARDPVVVPMAWFTPSGDGTEPDFERLEVTDFGSAVQLGGYEASSDAILYEFDPEYRRTARKESLQQDPSFGAALRRLRLQRGLSRHDFAPISAKQIARIERGETEAPRDSTLRQIAARLGVRPEEIAEY